jgi:hypothetical protein
MSQCNIFSLQSLVSVVCPMHQHFQHRSSFFTLVTNKVTPSIVASDSAVVLKCGCELSSDFLARVLGVDASRFLCDTQFYFPLLSLLLCVLCKRMMSSVHYCSWVVCMLMVPVTCV